MAIFEWELYAVSVCLALSAATTSRTALEPPTDELVPHVLTRKVAVRQFGQHHAQDVRRVVELPSRERQHLGKEVLKPWRAVRHPDAKGLDEVADGRRPSDLPALGVVRGDDLPHLLAKHVDDRATVRLLFDHQLGALRPDLQGASDVVHGLGERPVPGRRVHQVGAALLVVDAPGLDAHPTTRRLGLERRIHTNQPVAFVTPKLAESESVFEVLFAEQAAAGVRWAALKKRLEHIWTFLLKLDQLVDALGLRPKGLHRLTWVEWMPERQRLVRQVGRQTKLGPLPSFVLKQSTVKVVFVPRGHDQHVADTTWSGNDLGVAELVDARVPVPNAIAPGLGQGFDPVLDRIVDQADCLVEAGQALADTDRAVVGAWSIEQRELVGAHTLSGLGIGPLGELHAREQHPVALAAHDALDRRRFFDGLGRVVGAADYSFVLTCEQPGGEMVAAQDGLAMAWRAQDHELGDRAGGHRLKLLGNQRMVPVDFEARIDELAEVDEVGPRAFQLLGPKPTRFVRQLLKKPPKVEIRGVEQAVEGGHPSILDDGRQYLTKAYGREVPAVDSDVHHRSTPFGVGLKLLVHVATQKDIGVAWWLRVVFGCKFPRVVAAAFVGRDMPQEQSMIIELDGRCVIDLRETNGAHGRQCRIVVAQNCNMPTIESAKNPSVPDIAVKAKIAKMKHQIIGLCTGIESINQRLLHVTQAKERSATELTDIAMTKVLVAREPGGHRSVRYVHGDHRWRAVLGQRAPFDQGVEVLAGFDRLVDELL